MSNLIQFYCVKIEVQYLYLNICINESCAYISVQTYEGDPDLNH